MKLSWVMFGFVASILAGCQGGCNIDKMRDKAMEYKDKVPLDKIPGK